MFCRRNVVNRIKFFRNYLVPNDKNVISQNCINFKNYSCFTSSQRQINQLKVSKQTACIPYNLCYLHKLYCTKGSIDEDAAQIQKEHEDKELKKILQLFPQPRVTLNEFMAKMSDKIFDIHYKQNVMTPQNKSRTKKPVHNFWTCTYALVWPEIIKFDGTALSKRLAAEKAAMQALLYLYTNKHIDNQGQPIFKKEVLDKLKQNIEEPICVTITNNSIERIERLWNEYEAGIRNIYAKTFRESDVNTKSPAVLTKDSSLDEEDEYFEGEDNENMVADTVNETKLHPVYGKIISPPSITDIMKRQRALSLKFEKYMKHLTPLPIDEHTEEIAKMLDNSRVGIIVGAAGCGKSTRVPAAILKHCGAGASAIVSEPRRVAAIGLAERVASELGEDVGETIGYQVRLQSKPPRPPVGSVLFCTSGVLLRRLQSNPGLDGCTHVIIDEAHERDVNTDITLLLLKRALTLNKKLKIVIMSATLDVDIFTKYFDSCPVLQVPGKTYPVSELYLNDIENIFQLKLSATMESCCKEDGRPIVNCDEVVDVIKEVVRVHKEGAILVFLPGWSEIKQTKTLLETEFDNYMILPVHSRLSTTDQKKMFATPIPGVRKIILATNIAETSITIPDVTVVIDTGTQRENRTREGTGIASLETVWVSQAGAKQRSGRAGRVRPGHCYKLYTEEKQSEFLSHTTPEILRIPLEQTVLDCKTYAPDDKVQDFLSQLPQPPSHKAINFAVNDLIDLGALTPCERLTRLGSILSSLTLHPRLGAVLLYGAIAGSVVSAADVVTYCNDNVEVFENAADRRDEIRDIKRKYSKTSDHAALHWIQEVFEQVWQDKGWLGAGDWCAKEGLRKDRLSYVKAITKLHLEQILKSGLFEPTIEPTELNRFSENDYLTAGLLLAGSDSILKTKKRVKTKGRLATVIDLITGNGERAHVSTESVNYGITKKGTNNLLAYFGGYHSVERRALVVHKTSLMSPHTALLFCKGKIDALYVSDHCGNEGSTTLSLPKHKLQIHVPTSQAKNILKAREMLWNTFQYYIERNINNLDYDENIKISRFKVRLMKAIGLILNETNGVSLENVEKNDDTQKTQLDD